MDNTIAVIITITLTLNGIFVTSTQTGADGPNAQATAVLSGGSGAHQATRIVKRYIPQFVGKREQDSNPAVNTGGDENQEAELNTLDVENREDFLNMLREIEQLSRVHEEEDGYPIGNEDGNTLDDGDEDIYPGDYYAEQSNQFGEEFNEDDIDNEEINDEEFRSEEEGLGQSDVDKRYRPMFVGKRYKPMFVGKRYRPMFVGKRYRPMFVGKRYRPMFVGKRYKPMFIGKKYQPMFVGKRYQPMFVGKRYQPMFVGKRYRPMFVGKRDYEDKRYKPMFVGKRYIPRFVGKRYRPMFVGKRYRPMFVGKRSEETTPSAAENQGDIPMLLEKRSADEPVSVENMAQLESEAPKSRRKRSIMEANESDLLKRAWGRYTPWQDIPTYKIMKVESPLLDKRFVAPEFIGRRDSISSILSALNALRIARNEPRIASKRFQAPLFIGKRASETPNTLYWNPASDQSQLLDLESL